MDKKEIIDLLYKAIDFINGNDKSTITPNSYYRVVPSRRDRGFSDKYYIHVNKQANGGFWQCSMIDINLYRGTVNLSKARIFQEEWLQSLFKSSEITEINDILFASKWEEAEDILNQIAKI